MKKNKLPIFLIFFTLTGVLAPVWSSPDASLVLYLSFDELSGQTVKDHSSYGNHGALMGNPTLVEGKFGKALKFNGRSDWVEIPHDDSLTVTQSFTVMAWIKTPRHGGPKGALWQSIVAKGNDVRSYSFYTDTFSNGLHLSVQDYKGGSSRQHILLNRWQHVVGQVDNGIHRYWINGKLTAEFPIEATLPGLADTASVRVGNSHDAKPASAPDRHFQGLIDELRIWNRALSEDEILKEMQTGNTSTQTADTETDTQPTPNTENASRSEQSEAEK